MTGCTHIFGCFFFNDTATTEIYTLSLHDALPICADALKLFPAEMIGAVGLKAMRAVFPRETIFLPVGGITPETIDRKSTRLNSSHANISYAVFCLKKKTTYHRCSLVPSSIHLTMV